MQISQGINPETVFLDLYPVLYAASEPVDGGYGRSSAMTAAFVDAHGGLAGKRVLDMGCGYGLTSMALAAYAPREIVAVDNSPQMIELLTKVLLTNDDLQPWLEVKRAPEVLGDFFPPVIKHLEEMRAVFAGGVFRRRGGELIAMVGDGLSVDTLGIGLVDAVVANNYLHWPVNQAREQITKERPWIQGSDTLFCACEAALRPLTRLLPIGGIVVLMEPKDFMSFDDPEREQDLEANTWVSHPLFIKFHRTLNRLLKEEHGIDRQVPTTTGLFRSSELPEFVRRAGFRLRRVHHLEQIVPNAADAMCTRLPMLLGKINLPFEAKVGLGMRVRKMLPEVVSCEDLRQPVRVQFFYLVLERVE